MTKAVSQIGLPADATKLLPPLTRPFLCPREKFLGCWGPQAVAMHDQAPNHCVHTSGLNSGNQYEAGDALQDADV